MSKTTALRLGLLLYLAAAWLLLGLPATTWTQADLAQCASGWAAALIATFYISKGIER